MTGLGEGCNKIDKLKAIPEGLPLCSVGVMGRENRRFEMHFASSAGGNGKMIL